MSSAHEYLTINEAAALLGVHHHTVRRRVAEGVLTGYRLAASPLIRVRLDEVEALLSPIPSARRAA